ncbi:putative transcription elongation factor SPT5 homolog 1 [Tanacetum coccineum]|uniref:Transcription elongation factor SPT5 homolog 1 n=1 Tax=Tanacetum coccineum TaxID=301880 RepID=A0ABQ4YNN7_9ASTR
MDFVVSISCFDTDYDVVNGSAHGFIVNGSDYMNVGDENGILMTVGENGRIVNTELHKEATKAYMSYAMSVLLGRRCVPPAIMATDNFKTIWMLELGTLDGVLTTRPPWRWLDDQFGLLDYKTAQLVKEALKYGSGSDTYASFKNPTSSIHDANERFCTTPIHDGMWTPMRERAWNPYTPMSPPRDSWEDGNPGSWGSSPQYQPGSPRSRAYEAPTLGSGWANTSGGSYSEAGTPRDNTLAYAAHDTMFSIFTGTPGGQPMTPGGADLDIMSPGVGGDNDEPWFLPDILVNVRKSGDDAALGVIREVLLGVRKHDRVYLFLCDNLCSVWFASEMKALSDDCEQFMSFPPRHIYSIKTGGLRRWYNPPWYSECIPSTPYDPLVLRHAFEKVVIKRLMTDAKQILNLLLAIRTGSYPFPDPLESSITHDHEDVELDIDDIEIDEPVLVVPTSSHTKRKEEIGKRTDRQKLFDDDNAKINLRSSS